jgi:hypothetical protein
VFESTKCFCLEDFCNLYKVWGIDKSNLVYLRYQANERYKKNVIDAWANSYEQIDMMLDNSSVDILLQDN